mmetsp:Transcript_15396/g.27368  ORF Transcript_15396/g.27368 Transcript_15396/m.27368 type:complete len:197 (-) Transcript_15396:75-665(-)
MTGKEATIKTAEGGETTVVDTKRAVTGAVDIAQAETTTATIDVAAVEAVTMFMTEEMTATATATVTVTVTADTIAIAIATVKVTVVATATSIATADTPAVKKAIAVMKDMTAHTVLIAVPAATVVGARVDIATALAQTKVHHLKQKTVKELTEREVMHLSQAPATWLMPNLGQSLKIEQLGAVHSTSKERNEVQQQ